MSTWTINNKMLNSNATYTKDDYKVEVTYTQDATNNLLTFISGNVTKGQNGEIYVGNFSGNRQGDYIVYSFSGIQLQYMTDVITMVEEIEGYINNENEE